MPCQQPGVKRAVRHPPTRRSTIVPSLCAAGKPRRTRVTATASTTNEAALNPIVHAGPTVNISAVPNIGPMMRPLFHE